MAQPNKRVTVYLKPEFHRALRVKSAETEYSVSDLVNRPSSRRSPRTPSTSRCSTSDKGSGRLAFEDVVGN